MNQTNELSPKTYTPIPENLNPNFILNIFLCEQSAQLNSHVQ